MSDSAWTDLISDCHVLKLHDTSGCKCKKQITIFPKQCQLEGCGYKNNFFSSNDLKKIGTDFENQH